MALLLFALVGSAFSAQSQSTDEQIRVATLEIQSKEYASAEELLRKVLTEDSRSPIAHNLLGICQARTGDEEAARESFERAVELDPKFVAARVNLGNLLLGLREWAAALREFKAAIAADPGIFMRDPTSYVAFNIYGLCLMDDRNYIEARRAFERSIQINPQYAPAHANLGNVYVALKNDDAALKEFLAASILEPNDALALKNIGMIFGRKGQLDLAAKYLSQTHALTPQDPVVTGALAGDYISIGKDAEAKALVTELLGAGQLDSSARENLGLLWLNSDEPLNAVDLVQGDPGLSARCYKLGYQKAESAFESGRYQAARKILEAIRALEPPDGAFHDLLGSVYYAIDDPRKASEEFQQAVRQEPADPEHYFNLGMVFLKHRTPDPAIYVYDTGLKTCPDSAKLWLGLGLSYYFASRLEDAEKALRKAMALDPQYEVPYVVLGDLLEQSGRVDDALEIFRKTIEIHPNLSEAYYYYGKLELKQEHANVTDAVDKLRKAVALNPAFPEAHYELGKALAQAGEPQEAIAELNKSIALKPGLAKPYYQLGLLYKKMGDQAKSQEQLRSFEAARKKEQPDDLIETLDVHIEKP